MARWIRTDGTDQEVHPAGREFTRSEYHQYVTGSLTGHTLTRDEDGLFMFMDDESISKGLPLNPLATEILHQYRPDLSHLDVFGDVLIAGLAETGDE